MKHKKKVIISIVLISCVLICSWFYIRSIYKDIIGVVCVL